MEMTQHLRRMFAYDEWANREALASLKAAGAPPPRSLKLMAHIIAAERLWLERLKQEETAVVVWPELHAPAYTDFIHAVRRGFVE